MEERGVGGRIDAFQMGEPGANRFGDERVKILVLCARGGKAGGRIWAMGH